MKKNIYFWLLLGLLTFLRIRSSLFLGQTVDEAHYVLYGKFLDWSYFDHPPLVGWTHFVFQYLPFGDLLNSRLPSLLLSALTSYLIYYYLKKHNVSDKNSLLAVAILNLTPLFNTMSIALLPDSFLMPLTLLIIIQTEKILKISNTKNWLLLGLYLGLAGLAKYTAILYVVALILIFIYKKKWSELFKLPLWVGILAAFVLVSPVLYWNYLNEFISFKYQGDHVSNYESHIFKNLISSLGIQLFSWGIGPFLIALSVHFIWLKKIRELQTRFVSIIFLSVFLLFFIYVATAEALLPHWMLIYFVLMIPIAYSHWLEKNKNKFIYFASLVPSVLISLCLLLETAFQIFPARYTANLYEGVIGWSELLVEANLKLEPIKHDKKGIAVMNWTLGSRAMYYNKSQNSVFVLDKRKDQFDIWNPTDPVGYDFVILIEANKLKEQLPHLNCSDLNQIGEKTTKFREEKVNHFLIYHCTNYLGLNN